MPPKGTAQWAIRKTPERNAIMDELRVLLQQTRAGQGERIHGVLTDAQIIDWALEALRDQAKQETEPVSFRQGEYRHTR